MINVFASFFTNTSNANIPIRYVPLLPSLHSQNFMFFFGKNHFNYKSFFESSVEFGQYYEGNNGICVRYKC